jgi:hypothetical protein
VTAVRAVQVRAVVQSVHLVDGDSDQGVGRRLDRVEGQHRLAGGEGHDDLGAGSQLVEEGIWS